MGRFAFGGTSRRRYMPPRSISLNFSSLLFHLDFRKQLLAPHPSNSFRNSPHTLPVALKNDIDDAQTRNKQHDVATPDALPPTPLLPNLPQTVNSNSGAVEEVSVPAPPVDEAPHASQRTP